MQTKVSVQKQISLNEGEELRDFIGKVMNALSVQRMRMNASVHLEGIFDDHVIVRDHEGGKFFRMNHSRDGDAVALSDMIEVRQTFVPVAQEGEKVEKSAGPPEMVEVSVGDPLWGGIL